MLLDVIFMFCIDLWGFSIDPLYLVHKSTEQETLILCIFKFQGPSGTQTELGFFWRNYFSLGTNMRRRSTRVGLAPGPRHLCSFRTQSSDAIRFDLRLMRLT
jgi:hypothetical protein